MIKLLTVFDKVQKLNLDSCMTDKILATETAKLLDDLFAEFPFDSLPCPKCMREGANFNPVETKFIGVPLRDEHTLLYTHLPVFAYSCPHCKAQGRETISTDLLIDNTRLSLLYIFRMIHAHVSELDIQPDRREELEYALLSRESFSIWYRRFRYDVALLSEIAGGNLRYYDIFSGVLPMTDLFTRFFRTQHRCFLHANTDKKKSIMIVVKNEHEEYLCIDKAGRTCQYG